MPRFRENIKRMQGYNPPLEGRASRDYLLLDFNEMTVEPGQRIKTALKKFVGSGRLQTYPEYGDLNSKIAEYAGVKPSQVMFTNGSDQAIDVIVRALVGEGDEVIIPTPTFDMFYQSAGLQGADILKPIYRKDLSFPMEEVMDLITEEVKLLVICNPNNPTGTPVQKKNVLKILRKAKEKEVAVLHDEAYFEFSNITLKNFIKEFDNLFVTRTFSKQFGLASLRAGYLLSQRSNIQELLKVRGPYDVNMFAKTAIQAALEDTGYMKEYIEEVMGKSKGRMEAFLREQEVPFYPSAANFLLIRPRNKSRTIKVLKTEDILVRAKKGPNIEGTVRVSIGTLQDTERFIRACPKRV